MIVQTRTIVKTVVTLETAGITFETDLEPLAVEALRRALFNLYRAELPNASCRVLAIKAARAALGVDLRAARAFCEED